MKLLKQRNRFRVRKEVRKFSYFPLYYRGNLFWLTRIKIVKTFNGMSMRTINVQKL